MTVNQFLAAVKKYGLRFVMVGERRIRTRCGMCPIEALAVHMKLMVGGDFAAGHMLAAAAMLNLSDRTTMAIMTAADYTYIGRNKKYAPLAREIRRSLRAFTEKA